MVASNDSPPSAPASLDEFVNQTLHYGAASQITDIPIEVVLQAFNDRATVLVHVVKLYLGNERVMFAFVPAMLVSCLRGDDFVSWTTTTNHTHTFTFSFPQEKLMDALEMCVTNVEEGLRIFAENDWF